MYEPSWTQADDELYRCLRHPKEEPFPPWQPCPACTTDPAPEDDGGEVYEPGEPIAPPEGCTTSAQHERWFVELATHADEQARSLCRGKGRINYATAAKLFDVAIRARRAASDLCRWREDNETVDRRERRFRADARKRH